MAAALLRSEAIKWNPQMLRDHAEHFDTRVFSERFMQLVSRMTAAKQRQVAVRIIARGDYVQDAARKGAAHKMSEESLKR
jgi:hypothetical protein